MNPAPIASRIILTACAAACVVSISCADKTTYQTISSDGGLPPGLLGSGTDAASANTQQFDTPAELTLICTGDAVEVVLELPCQMGFNLNGQPGLGSHAVQCDLAAPLGGKLALVVSVSAEAAFLNQPMDTAGVVTPVTSEQVLSDAVSYAPAALVGTITFSSVEPRRAFIAQFQDLIVDWAGSSGHRITCSGTNIPFWATPGDFL